MKTMRYIFKGIHSLQNKECGCKIKRYVGGKVVIEKCIKHSFLGIKTEIYFICPSCGIKYKTKKESKNCAWSHAI